MSASREHKRRYYQRQRYNFAFEKWLDKEPRRIFFRQWRKWKKARPVLEDYE